ncbi:MAG: ATP-binding protein [Ferruginibacter sp.]
MRIGEKGQINVNKKDETKLSKYLLTLYQSDIQLDLMYNSICRLFAKCHSASSVSLQLYNGFSNSLKVSGIYLNLRQYNKSLVAKNKYKQILSNVLLYEYARHNSKDGIYEGEILTYADFKSYCNEKNVVFHDVEEERFEEFKKNLKDLWPYYEHYLEVIKKDDVYVFGQERHEGDANKVYIEFINQFKNAVVQPTEGKVFDKKGSINIIQTAELLMEKGVLEKFEYQKLVYFPLVFKGRVFGLLRLTFNARHAKKILSIKGKLVPRISNSLESALTSISFYIGRQYPQTALLKLDLHSVVNKDNLDEVCEGFRQMVNCYGCIIRILKRGEYVITGRTSNVNKYINEYTDNVDFFKNNKSLLQIFNKRSNKSSYVTILGLQFSIAIDPTTEQLHVVDETYYYCDDEEIIRSTSDINKLKKKRKNQIYIKDVFTQHYCKICVRHQIREVIILPIFDSESQMGYLTFANTEYKFFFKNDINVIYPYVQRLGLEYLAKKSNIKDFQVLYLDHINHEFLSPVENAIKFLDNPKKSSIEKIEIAKGKLLEIKYHTDEISQFNSIRYDEDFNLTETAYDLDETLVARGIKFYDILTALEKSKDVLKGGNIRAVDYQLKNLLPENFMTNYNEDLIALPLLHLLTNALKYSFNSKFRPASKNSSVNADYAHRLVIIQETSVDRNFLYLKVINWGLELPRNKNIIFKQRKRSEEAKKMAPLNGNGNGLTIAKRFVKWLGGDIIPNQTADNKTTFTIKLPLWPSAKLQ